MTRHDVPELEASIDIDAPPAVVWGLIGDVTRMPEWSPQVTSSRLRAGFEAVALGTEFTNRNALGEMEWTTHATIVAFEPETHLAFRVEENWVIWSFGLEPTVTGTCLTQRRLAPEGVSGLSHELTEGFMGGTEKFAATLREGMTETLAKLKAAAESTRS